MNLNGRWHIVLKAFALALSVASLVALTSSGGCGKNEPSDPCKPDGCAVANPSQKKGDGIWSVGDELKPGTWSLDSSWTDHKKYPNCAWFVTAAPNKTAKPSKEPTFSQHRTDPGDVTIHLHAGEHLTSSGCPVWKRIGD